MSASKLVVVCRPMAVMGVVSQISKLDRDKTLTACHLQHAVLERALKGFGEEGQNVKVHLPTITKLAVPMYGETLSIEKDNFLTGRMAGIVRNSADLNQGLIVCILNCNIGHHFQ